MDPAAAESGPRVVLASGSPRRRELLGYLGVPFEVLVSGTDENSPEPDPARLAAELALSKAREVAALRPGSAVLGADTVVSQGGQLLAKPADAEENLAFLRVLSGRTHDVFTGVALVRGGQEWQEVAHTRVTFRPLTESEMAHYAASGEGLDKAGGYGIQQLGAALVERIEGEYSNVVGLPLTVVLRLLRAAGVPVWGEPGPGA